MPASPSATPEALAGRALVVDDNETNRQIVEHYLKGLGLAVVLCADSRQAFALVTQATEAGRPFDIVLTDLHMPHVDGLTLARALRRDARSAHLPIAVLTSLEATSYADIDAGHAVQAWLTKPLRRHQLGDTVRTLLSSAEGRAPVRVADAARHAAAALLQLGAGPRVVDLGAVVLPAVLVDLEPTAHAARRRLRDRVEGGGRGGRLARRGIERGEGREPEDEGEAVVRGHEPRKALRPVHERRAEAERHRDERADRRARHAREAVEAPAPREDRRRAGADGFTC